LRKNVLYSHDFENLKGGNVKLYEVTIPAFSGPDQGKPWVGVLRKLSEVGYY